MIYNVWMEGFMFSLDERAEASLVGSVEADSFQEACDKLLKNSPTYNSYHLTEWGCQLFDNEKAARKRFG